MAYTYDVKIEHNRDGEKVGTTYLTLSQDEYKKMMDSVMFDIGRCKDCVHQHMTRDDKT